MREGGRGVADGRGQAVSERERRAELGRLGGKYFIDSITHHIGGGYTMDLELSRVE